MKQDINYKQTEIGEIPQGWSVISLGSIIDVIGGYAFKSKDFQSVGLPVIKIKNVTNDGLDLSNAGFVADKFYEDLEKYRVNPYDVLISLTGSNVNQMSSAVGKICMADDSTPRALVNQRVGKIVSTGESDSVAYSYNYLRQKRIRYLLALNAKGAANQANISPSQIKALKIPYPEKKERLQILNLISSLDDKIELNHKMNQTLEEMGKALFKQWFVNFEFPNNEGKPYKSSSGEMVNSELGKIPKGWSAKKIGELDVTVTDFVANGSFASLKKNVAIKDEPDYALFLRNTDLKNNFKSGGKFVDKHSYEFLAKTKLFGGEVIISNVGDVGSVYRCPFFSIPMTLGNNQIVIIGRDKNLFLYLLFISPLGQSFIDSITSGSVQNKFNKTDFRNLRIVWPSEKIHQNFIEVLSPLYHRIENNKAETKNLISLRDSLLPRLMSGRLRVNN